MLCSICGKFGTLPILCRVCKHVAGYTCGGYLCQPALWARKRHEPPSVVPLMNLRCDDCQRAAKRMKQAQQAWALRAATLFTDPKHHNPQKYAYLVHGVKASRAEDVAGGAGELILTNPREALRRIRPISTSLISATATTTWGGTGLILQVPSDAVFAASWEDIGLENWNADLDYPLSKFMSKGLMLPDAILSGTKSSWNEIGVMGGPGISVIGVFVQTQNRDPTDKDMAGRYVRFADENSLPIVELPIDTENSYETRDLVQLASKPKMRKRNEVKRKAVQKFRALSSPGSTVGSIPPKPE